MKHKGIILLSTVLVFVLATIVSVVWLFKIRHVEIEVVAETTQEIITYDKVNDLVEDTYKGKSYFRVKASQVETTLCQDPYIKVKSVKKVFPDRLKIQVEKRKERFAILYQQEYFVTDSEYHLLRKVSDGSQLEDDIIKITLTNINIDAETLVLGQKIGAENDVLVGRMTAIFAKFSDGLNLVKNVTVMGDQNWIRFNTKTGVVIEFSFAPSDPKASEEVKNAEAEKLVDEANEVEKAYHSLSEDKKRIGYLLVSTKADGKIAIEHTTEHKE